MIYRQNHHLIYFSSLGLDYLELDFMSILINFSKNQNHFSIQEQSSFDVVEPPQDDDPFATISQANAEQVSEPAPVEQPPTEQLQVNQCSNFGNLTRFCI